MSIYRLHTKPTTAIEWAYWVSYQTSDGEKKRLLVWKLEQDTEVRFTEKDKPLHEYAEQATWFHMYSKIEQLGLGKLMRLMHEALEEGKT